MMYYGDIIKAPYYKLRNAALPFCVLLSLAILVLGIVTSEAFLICAAIALMAVFYITNCSRPYRRLKYRIDDEGVHAETVPMREKHCYGFRWDEIKSVTPYTFKVNVAGYWGQYEEYVAVSQKQLDDLVIDSDFYKAIQQRDMILIPKSDEAADYLLERYSK